MGALGAAGLDSEADAAALIWLHVPAIGYSPRYLNENRDGVRSDWPRIPLPATKDTLVESASLGRRIASLLDTEHGVEGVTTGTIRPELRIIAEIEREGGLPLNPTTGDFDLTAGWGRAGDAGAVMPGKGRVVERDYTSNETAGLAAGACALGLSRERSISCLGARTHDIYLNDFVCWKNIPSRVWDYRIGGYQVAKKWLSYREREILGRGLTLDEVTEVRQTARRIAAILLLEPALDANYEAVIRSAYQWPGAGGVS